MAPTGHRPPREVRITRTFAAPREKVFRAFIDPEAVRVWFAPTGASWVGPPAIDARPEGRYRFTILHEGKRFSIHGSYLEVKAPARLVFTWQYENDPDRGETADTVVTVEFLDRDGRTEVTLTHERFPSDAAREDHATGWAGCLEAIGKLVS